jgi:hypothetical protein
MTEESLQTLVLQNIILYLLKKRVEHSSTKYLDTISISQTFSMLQNGNPFGLTTMDLDNKQKLSEADRCVH